MNRAVLLFLSTIVVAQQPDPVFRSGTRLVQVDVVVRAERVRPPGFASWLAWAFDSGPPYGPPGDPIRGLAKADFTVLDNGKPQAIAVFSAQRAPAAPVSLLPGAVSNRVNSRGESSVTAVLVDLLNTSWELTEYARLGVKRFMAGPEEPSAVAVYSLGKSLHVLRDFNAGRDFKGASSPPGEVDAALRDYGDPPTAFVDFRERARATTQAVSGIIQHLSGLPGRKNLIWLSQGPPPPAPVMAMMRQANIVLYPVHVRQAPSSETGTPSGGRIFFDALDLTSAVHTAEEDAAAAYILGYYPSAGTLDGAVHSIAVKLNNPEFAKQSLEIHYRSGYIASKTAILPPALSLAEVFLDPLDATGIGLLVQATVQAAPGQPQRFDARVTIDIRDLRLERKGARFTGAIDYAVPDPSSPRAFRTGTVTLSLTDRQLADALLDGLTLEIRGIEPQSREIRIAIRDRSTGVAGSIRLPVSAPEPRP